MKKLSIVLLIAIFVFAGCNWFEVQGSVERSYGVSAPDLIDEVLVDDPELDEPADTVDTEDEASASSESKEVVLAKCLTEQGVKLYTASWCGHCKVQKELFADGLEYLDNTECAEGDGWAQACDDANITSVPTWVLADGTIQKGTTQLADLAEMAGCTY